MERCEARKNVDYVNFTVPWKHSNPRAAAAVFARYSNLLEHVVTLCDFAASRGSHDPVDLLFEETSAHLKSVYVAKIRKSDEEETSQTTDHVHTTNLGRCLGQIIDEKLPGGPTDKSEKPFSPKDGAFIVRCILAAWSWQVHNIELIEPVADDEESLLAEGGGGEHLVPERSRIATVDELPPVFVFG
jgi:hypothetical protein